MENAVSGLGHFAQKRSKHLDGSTNRFEDENKFDFNIETSERNDK